MPDISIVIVNYNVKDYLYKCINSIRDAQNNLDVEIIIIDNNSSDGSVEFLKNNFEDIILIEQKTNSGFAIANNIGIELAKGKYILILNPDTLLSKDTLTYLYNYMEQHSDIGASTCKVLNGDGSFQDTCRRSFPTPFSAFNKLFGIQKLFPNSIVFGKYNLEHLDIDRAYEVEAIGGSFMFFRADLLKELGGFDTDYFMYGEDLDLCYRVNKANRKIMYLPETTIIHYKGESTKRSNINEIGIFYNAMEIFVKKHYSKSAMFMLLLNLGIKFRELLSYIFKYKMDIMIILFDIISLTLGMILGSKIKFNSFLGFPDYAYPTVFLIPPLLLIAIMILIGEYFEYKKRISNVFYGYSILFLLISTLTYFFPEYRFSRGIVLFMSGFGILLSSLLRILLLFKEKYSDIGERNNIIIIGSEKSFNTIIKEFGTISPGIYRIIGFVNNDIQNTSNYWLGTIEHLGRIIKEFKIKNIMISDFDLSFEKIKRYTLDISLNQVKFHYVHKFHDFIVSQILNEINDNSNIKQTKLKLLRFKLIKRVVDIVVSIIGIVVLFPLTIILVRAKGNFDKLVMIIKNKATLVGIIPAGKYAKDYKAGIINFSNISKNKIIDDETINKLNDFYINNYSISLDFEILFRKIIGK